MVRISAPIRAIRGRQRLRRGFQAYRPNRNHVVSAKRKIGPNQEPDLSRTETATSRPLTGEQPHSGLARRQSCDVCQKLLAGGLRRTGDLLLSAHGGLDRSLHRGTLAHVGSSVSATAATTTIAAAAIAATVATMMASVATAAIATAVMATGLAMMASATAAACTTAATAATKDEGRSLALTADEGDTNQGEKHRQTKNNNTVHPRILQNYLQVP
jgi:hypothetical protein